MKKKKNNTTILQTSSFVQLLYSSSAEQNSKLNRKKMATASFTSCCFSGARHGQWPHMMQVRSSLFEMSSGGRREGFSRDSTADSGNMDEGSEKSSVGLLKRRLVVGSGLCLASGLVLSLPGDGLAVKQGLLAGRIPGLSEPDGNGWRTYRRPDEKSGGHGVGWSPIIPYTFAVPREWEEVPVSIADLGGTEIDLRFASSKEGRLFVVVAPVLRFADLQGNATIEEIGTPEKVINAFGPEVLGESVEGKVLSMEVAEHSGRKYYMFELEPPHIFITATAAGNRLYLFNVTANGLQWKRHVKDLKMIADSFRVV